MIYLLYGPNSYKAFGKVREFKEAFLKKIGGNAGSFLIEEINGDAPGFLEKFWNEAEQAPLFSKKRLVILKETLSDASFAELFKKNATALKVSPDVFIFWETELKKTESIFKLFEKCAEKIQEMKELSGGELDRWLEKKALEVGIKLDKTEREIMIEGCGSEWALENELEKMVLGASSPRSLTLGVDGLQTPSVFPRGSSSPFSFVERIFSSRGMEVLLVLKRALEAGHDPQRFIYPLLWKAKQKKMIDVYKHGILAESAMRRDPKNAYEHMEIFILAIKA